MGRTPSSDGGLLSFGYFSAGPRFVQFPHELRPRGEAAECCFGNIRRYRPIDVLHVKHRHQLSTKSARERQMAEPVEAMALVFGRTDPLLQITPVLALRSDAFPAHCPPPGASCCPAPAICAP